MPYERPRIVHATAFQRSIHFQSLTSANLALTNLWTTAKIMAFEPPNMSVPAASGILVTLPLEPVSAAYIPTFLPTGFLIRALAADLGGVLTAGGHC